MVFLATPVMRDVLRIELRSERLWRASWVDELQARKRLLKLETLPSARKASITYITSSRVLWWSEMPVGCRC